MNWFVSREAVQAYSLSLDLKLRSKKGNLTHYPFFRFWEVECFWLWISIMTTQILAVYKAPPVKYLQAVLYVWSNLFSAAWFDLLVGVSPTYRTCFASTCFFQMYHNAPERHCGIVIPQNVISWDRGSCTIFIRSLSLAEIKPNIWAFPVYNHETFQLFCNAAVLNVFSWLGHRSITSMQVNFYCLTLWNGG